MDLILCKNYYFQFGELPMHVITDVYKICVFYFAHLEDPDSHTFTKSFELMFLSQFSQSHLYFDFPEITRKLLLINLLFSISVLRVPTCLVCNLHLQFPEIFWLRQTWQVTGGVPF